MTTQAGPKPSDKAQLQLQAARAREASPPGRRYDPPKPVPARQKAATGVCPGCRHGCHVQDGVYSCPDCGEFVSNGAGGYAQRGHSAGVACRQVLELQAPMLTALETSTVLLVVGPRGKGRIDVRDALIAASLREFKGNVAEWLESRGQYLRGIEVDGEVIKPVNRGARWP